MNTKLVAALLCAVLAWCLSLNAAAQSRPIPIPQDTLRGKLVMDVFPQVVINNQLRTMEAGAVIRDENNRIVLPATVMGEKVVRYKVNAQSGHITAIWILTAAEAARR